jgi:hypothetical protein
MVSSMMSLTDDHAEMEALGCPMVPDGLRWSHPWNVPLSHRWSLMDLTDDHAEMEALLVEYGKCNNGKYIVI